MKKIAQSCVKTVSMHVNVLLTVLIITRQTKADIAKWKLRTVAKEKKQTQKSVAKKLKFIKKSELKN